MGTSRPREKLYKTNTINSTGEKKKKEWDQR